MKKLKIGVVFGGMSTEHEVSIVSGTSVIKNLTKEKYEIFPIYISKDGKWYKYIKNVDEINILKLGEVPKELEKIENELNYLKQLDVVFPVLHGLYGEDGTIQGLFELVKIPYVGCKVLGSSLCMDKVYAKAVFAKANIKQAEYMYIRKDRENYVYIDENFNEFKYNIKQIYKKVEELIGFPVFIKPSNSGSSIGINKSKDIKELEEYIEHAAQFDKKILIERSIEGREVECSVLGNEDVKTSCIGEILPVEHFYTFDAKYKNLDSKTVIPANITEEQSNYIQEKARKAYKATDCKGFARVDFFIENETEDIFINEINTIPGFTNISMYPKLWEESGMKYSELLDKLIELAF